ncbi:MAG: imidazole glycerol phosphate synthase subunit HisH [Acidimicrobiia bacterium]|nr:MAG: imidazole glycerol phosphate synthase subunit HisH [Acidimicrobiia bacterium]
MSLEVAIVPTGTANLASVVAGMRRAGATPTTVSDADQVARAERVVVPGVGAFGAAMATIDRMGMRTALRERVIEGRPTLAVCVGMQLLCSTSEESPAHTGLGVIAGRLTRFAGDVRVPQLGWNQVEPELGMRFLTDGWAYFANSYRMDHIPEGWTGAMSDHGGAFVAGLERGDVLACQFHPELSGHWGEAVLSAWLSATEGAR